LGLMTKGRHAAVGLSNPIYVRHKPQLQ
jgi:hypothetical protein